MTYLVCLKRQKNLHDMTRHYPKNKRLNTKYKTNKDKICSHNSFESITDWQVFTLEANKQVFWNDDPPDIPLIDIILCKFIIFCAEIIY